MLALEDILSPQLQQAIDALDVDTSASYPALSRRAQGLVRSSLIDGRWELWRAIPALERLLDLRIGWLQGSVAFRDAAAEAGLVVLRDLVCMPIDRLWPGEPPRNARRLSLELVHMVLEASSDEGARTALERLAAADVGSRSGKETDYARDTDGSLRLDLLTDEHLVIAWAESANASVRSLADVHAMLGEEQVPQVGRVRSAAARIKMWNEGEAARVRAELSTLVEDALRFLLETVASSRAGAIFVRRELNDERVTLQELGDEMGVTRERVRQLQVAGRREFEGHMSNASAWPLLWSVEGVSYRLGTAFPERVLHDDPGYKRLAGCDNTSQPTVEVLFRRLLRARVDKGWIYSKDGVPPTRAAAMSVAHGGVVLGDDGEVSQRLGSLGIRADVVEAWLSDCPGLGYVAGRHVVWPRNLVERATLVLSMEGDPMNVDELREIIGPEMSRQGVRNRLFEGLVRTGANEVALPGSDREEYRGISYAIEDRIRSDGGWAYLSVLEVDLPARFGVSAASVAAFARAPFFLIEGKRVRLRPSNEPYCAVGSPSDHQMILRGDAADALHVVVPCSPKVLRGFSIPIPESVAAALGVTPGGRREFSGSDAVTLSWNARSILGPMLGSLRAFAEAHDLDPGDALVVMLDEPSGEAHVRAVRAPKADPQARRKAIAALLGFDPQVDGERTAHRLWAEEASEIKDWEYTLQRRCPVSRWFGVTRAR